VPDSPHFPAFEDFPAAADAVLALLRERTDLDLWMLTRVDGDDWTILRASRNGYDIESGQVLSWSDSFCSRMVEGAPMVAPRAHDVAAYASAPIAQALQIGAYVGVPVASPDGELFGTLCAIDPEAQPADLDEHRPVVELLARLLGTILHAEMAGAEADRRRELAEAESLTDGLTGLPNRRAWDRFVQQEEARCRRYGHPACVLIVDLDGLKETNDHAGHAAGDALLQTAAQVLRSACRMEDLAARLGGDEFGILAPESDEAAGQVLRRRLSRALAEAGVEASIGVAARRPDRDLAATTGEADAAMYLDKRARTG
jgi:diguanylate cyclase